MATTERSQTLDMAETRRRHGLITRVSS
jgi:hypothetical protein